MSASNSCTNLSLLAMTPATTGSNNNNNNSNAGGSGIPLPHKQPSTPSKATFSFPKMSPSSTEALPSLKSLNLPIGD